MKRLVYLISPDNIHKKFYSDLAKILLYGNVKFFQLRLKNLSQKKIALVAKKIKKITEKYKVKLIINDSPKIAKKINADGCHIGQLDGAMKDARKILNKKIIGVTCHNSKKLALIASKNDANYIALGSFYRSKLKPNATKANLKILKWAKRKLKKPIVAIGGITDKNYKNLIKVGANYIAISTFIWNNPKLKPEVAIKKFK